MVEDNDDKHLPAAYQDEHASDGFDRPEDRSDRTIIGLL
jgi:hypothetical protein